MVKNWRCKRIGRNIKYIIGFMRTRYHDRNYFSIWKQIKKYTKCSNYRDLVLHNIDGASNASGATYLDRTIEHELIHAYMASSIQGFWELKFVGRQGYPHWNPEYRYGEHPKWDDEDYCKEYMKESEKIVRFVAEIVAGGVGA